MGFEGILVGQAGGCVGWFGLRSVGSCSQKIFGLYVLKHCHYGNDKDSENDSQRILAEFAIGIRMIEVKIRTGKNKVGHSLGKV